MERYDTPGAGGRRKTLVQDPLGGQHSRDLRTSHLATTAQLPRPLPRMPSRAKPSIPGALRTTNIQIGRGEATERHGGQPVDKATTSRPHHGLSSGPTLPRGTLPCEQIQGQQQQPEWSLCSGPASRAKLQNGHAEVKEKLSDWLQFLSSGALPAPRIPGSLIPWE